MSALVVRKPLRAVIAAVAVIGMVSSGIAFTIDNGVAQAEPKPAPSSSNPQPAEAMPASVLPSKKSATDPLTGHKLNKGPVWVVKIDNVAAAHPQIAVGKADIVVVEEVEGSLTRLAAVFHTKLPTKVGPVRSGRNTDVELFPMFGKPGFLYSGANSKVKRNISRASLVPVLRTEPRDNSRSAPHNVMLNLKSIAKDYKSGKVKSIGWSFAKKDERWRAKEKTARSPKVKVGGDTFGFKYSKGSYSVSWNGKNNKDGRSGQQVKTDNVIVLSVKNRHDNDTTAPNSTVSSTVGKGKVVIYRNGKKRTGTWKRDKVSGPMTFTDKKGRDLTLKPGKSWLLLQG